MERSYDQAQDMWSLGCIIYELLKYITRENKTGQAEFKRQRYLFKGSSCFPLSPLKNETGQSTSIVALEDQMHIILKSLGRQTETDLSFLTCDYSTLYVRKLEDNISYSDETCRSLPKMCAEIKSKLTKKGEAVVEIMLKLLQLNPFFRPTAKECIKNKVFDPFRDSRKERILDEMVRKRQEEQAFPMLASSSDANGYE